MITDANRGWGHYLGGRRIITDSNIGWGKGRGGGESE